MLYAVPYNDKRERRHVVAVNAENAEEALKKVVEFQCQNCPNGEYYGGWYYNGFDYDPDIEDVIVINPGEDVQIIFHGDYD
jgi:hypothetical protein